MTDDPLEQLRSLWTPNGDVEVIEVDDAPRTQLDSQVRDLLCRVLQQHGPMRVVLERDGAVVLNTGVLRWEVAGIPGYREVSLWIEREER